MLILTGLKGSTSRPDKHSRPRIQGELMTFWEQHFFHHVVQSTCSLKISKEVPELPPGTLVEVHIPSYTLQTLE